MAQDTWSLLPTGEKMNPMAPEDAFYFDSDQVAYVMSKTGSEKLSLRVFTSLGRIRGWTIGSEHEIKHDQTQRYLGRYTVVGIKNFKTGTQSGGIPDRKLKHWVFK